MARNGFQKLDYSMLSSYLGRWATLIIFAVTILIAVGALFLKEDDIAHMPVKIGVFDLDSAKVHQRFVDFAGYIREKGGGDIQWRFLKDQDEPTGCDFYIMTSLRFAPYLLRGGLDCSLLIPAQEGRRYSTGGIIVKAGGPDMESEEMTAVFTSRFSAANFLSPYNSLVKTLGESQDEGILVDFAGSEERVIYGVIFGAYTFGGISLERLNVLGEMDVYHRGELEVFLEGEPYPEMVLAVDKSMEERKHRRFRDRFVILADRMPDGLKADLGSFGISGFVPPRPEDIEVIGGLWEVMPPRFGAAMERPGGPS